MSASISTEEWGTGPVTVAVPATSANLGPGFDSLGLALDLVDEVSAEVVRDGYQVEVIGEGAGEVPTGADHLIVATMLTAFERMGVSRPPGLRLNCRNRIPHARGLGSSSAAIVAGICLARALVVGRAAGSDETAHIDLLTDAAALALAAELEGHPDNVAPCLLGGFTIAWTASDGAHAVRLTPAESITPVVYVPSVRGLTAHARAALPAQVPHRDAVFNSARSALLVHALTSAPDLLLAATEDRLHQPYRAPAMPETAALVARLREAGVPAFVSGAGPSVLALTTPGGPGAPPTASGHPPLDPPSGWWSTSLSYSSTGARML
jgi:homoserine kinase